MTWSKTAPLASRLRPKSFDEYIGQQLGLKRVLQSITNKRATSFVFWGPPGCGKTSLAELYCKSFSHPVEKIHATSTQTQEIKRIIERTKTESLLFHPTIVWIDEVHRLTRPQQDTLLQSLEEGSLILVCATTENPSFQLTGALLSRVQVVTLSAHSEEDLRKLLERALLFCPTLQLTDEAKNRVISWAGGDARALVNMLEMLLAVPHEIQVDDLATYLQKKTGALNAAGDDRYMLISALHKAVRGSDCQAALYWLSRLIVQGEDVRYIARRLIRMATEDIGLSDPEALDIALNGLRAYEILGSPEGELAIAEVVIYLALAPKSNALYMAYKEALSDAEKSVHLMPPKHIINAPTAWMKREGFSSGYRYDHDEPNAHSGQNYFPDTFSGGTYYQPVERGFERELAKRLAYFLTLRTGERKSK